MKPHDYQDTYKNLLDAFVGFAQKKLQLKNNETTLLAVSGGIDSIVMAALFKSANLKFAIAHCNFGLRKEAAKEDEKFVYQIAQNYKVAYYSTFFDTKAYAQQHRLSIQMAARNLRYTWLEGIRSQHQLNWIATAHHLDDLLETILLNFTKGTGITGLRGMLAHKGHVIRPLLFTSKQILLQYAQHKGLVWREDISNTSNVYQRNRIRNQVIPILQSINPNLVYTTQITAERLLQVDLIVKATIKSAKQKIFRTFGNIHEILLDPIQQEPWATVVLWEVLKPFGFHFSQIQHLLATKLQSGKFIYSPTHQLYIDRNKWFIMAHTPSIKYIYTITHKKPQMLRTIHYNIQTNIFFIGQYTIPLDKQIAALDLSCLTFPLTIRTWQPGDAFYPLGMQKKKKISDFLIDIKIPRFYKNQVHVLTSGNEIVWVIGYRIDDRFKINHTTQNIYEIRLLDKRPLLE